MMRDVTLGRRIVAAGVLSGFIFAATGSQADPTQGLCNALVAQALGAGLQVANSGPTVEQCTEIGQALGAVIQEPCLSLLVNGELLGIVSSASTMRDGSASPLGTKICTGLQECGFLPIPNLPQFCPGF